MPTPDNIMPKQILNCSGSLCCSRGDKNRVQFFSKIYHLTPYQQIPIYYNLVAKFYWTFYNLHYFSGPTLAPRDAFQKIYIHKNWISEGLRCVRICTCGQISSDEYSRHFLYYGPKNYALDPISGPQLAGFGSIFTIFIATSIKLYWRPPLAWDMSSLHFSSIYKTKKI